MTRIDTVLADDRILDRLIEVEILPTKVSDHNAILWSIETIIKKKKTPYDKISTTMMTNQEFKLKFKEMFEIEKYNVIEGYERFKRKCVETSMKIRKKTLRRTKKNKVIRMKEI